MVCLPLVFSSGILSLVLSALMYVPFLSQGFYLWLRTHVLGFLLGKEAYEQ